MQDFVQVQALQVVGKQIGGFPVDVAGAHRRVSGHDFEHVDHLPEVLVQRRIQQSLHHGAGAGIGHRSRSSGTPDRQ